MTTPRYGHNVGLHLLEPHYSAHVSAMTSEALHGKSDIAAELAWRDLERDRLAAENARLRDTLRQLKRGRECAASSCQAPLTGQCSCGNARLVAVIVSALQEGQS